MKRTQLTIPFILIAICSFGQTKFGIKIYQNTDIFNAEYIERRNNNNLTKFNYLNFDRFSVALDIDTKNKLTHEIEILIPEISKSTEHIQFPMNYEFRKDPTFESKASTYSLRYELSKTFSTKSGRFAFNLGLGINPYYVHIEYIPNVETTYYWSTQLYGAVVNITPRIKYKLSDRFSIDLNVPLKVYDLRGERNQVKNPAIPIRQQTTQDFDNIFFETAYTIRFGVMYSLN